MANIQIMKAMIQTLVCLERDFIRSRERQMINRLVILFKCVLILWTWTMMMRFLIDVSRH